MKYLLLLILLFLFSNKLISQEERLFINGKVQLNSLAISDAHIINLNTKIGTVSDPLGFFNIPVNVGDSLNISHLNLKEVNIIITKAHLKSLTLSIVFKEKVTSLAAFTLERPIGIFEEEKEVFTYNGPIINAKTLNLPYASTTAKPDNKVFKIQSGFVVGLDNLLNLLNGSVKNAKGLRILSSEDKQLVKIRKYFTDDFFITDLQIQQNNINSFLNFCVQKNIISLFQKKDYLNITKILLKESNQFPQKDSSQIKIAFKKISI